MTYIELVAAKLLDTLHGHHTDLCRKAELTPAEKRRKLKLNASLLVLSDRVIRERTRLINKAKE